MKVIEILTIEAFECACGNDGHSQGFFPCDTDGNIIEPSPSWSGHYCCDRCKQVYLSLE